MALRLVCPSCQESFAFAEGLSTGAEATCPFCGRRFEIDLEGRFEFSEPASSSDRGGRDASPGEPRRSQLPSPLLSSNREAGNTGPIRFTFACVNCRSILEATQDHSGRTGRCPTCGGMLTIPPVDPVTGLGIGPAQPAFDGQPPTPLHAYAGAGAKAPTIQRLPDGEAVIICPRCGSQMPIDAHICSACGNPFTMEGAESTARLAPERNRVAEWALAVGVLAIPTYCLPVFGVTAVVLGLLGLRRAGRLGPAATGRRRALTGMILGLASVALFAALSDW